MKISTRKLISLRHPSLNLWHRTVDCFTWNTLIRAYVQRTHQPSSPTHTPLSIFLRMRFHGVHIDYYTFPFLLQSVHSPPHLQLGRSIHSQVLIFGFSSDPFVQTSLISMYTACGDVGSAREVFDEMCERGIQPNVVTFGTLINGLCVNREINEAFRMKKIMERDFKLKPNAFVFVALIKGLCKVDDLDAAVKMKEEMLRKKVELDSAVYSTLISAYFRVGRRDEVNGLLTEMEMNGCKCDTVTFNALMHGYCQEKDFDSAFKVLDEMEGKGCKPDVISCNVIIRGLCDDGKLREASELLDDMPRRRCKPDVVSYRIYLDGLCKAKQFKEAAVILHEMVFKGYIPRDTSLCKLLDGLIQEGDRESLLRALDNMASVNCISKEVWEMVISMMCQQDNLCSASALVGMLTNDGVNKFSL